MQHEDPNAAASPRGHGAPAPTRRWRRRALIGGAGGLLLVLAALLVLHSSPVRVWGLQRAIAALQAQGVRASAETLDWNLLRLRFRLTQLQLSAGPENALPFFRADELEVDLPFAALRGTAALEALTVRGGRVRLLRDAAGVWALPATGAGNAASQEGVPTTLPIGRLIVTDFAVELDDRAAGVSAGLSGIDLQLEEVSADGAGALTTGGGRVGWNGGGLPVDALRAQLRYNGADLAVESFTLEAAPLRIAASGSVRGLWTGPLLALRASGTADLGGLLRVAGIDRPGVAGSVRADASLEGPAGAPEAAFEVGGEALRWGDLEDIELAASGALVDGELHVETLRAGSAAGRVEATGSWLFGQGPGELTATLRGLDLDTVLGELLDDTLPRPAALLDVDARASWSEPTLAAMELYAEGRARPQAEGTRRPALAGRATLQLQTGGMMGLDLDARIGGMVGIRASLSAGLTGTGADPLSWNDVALDGDGTIVVDDLATTMARAIELELIAPLGLDPPEGLARAAWQLEGTVGAPRLSADLSATGLVVAGISLPGSEARLLLDESGARLSHLRARADALELTASGSLGVGGAPLELRADLAIADLAALPLAALADYGMAGALAVGADVHGDWSAPQVALNLTGADLSAAGQQARRLQADAILRDGSWRLSAAEITQEGGGRLVLSGELSESRAVLVAQPENFVLTPPAGAALPSLPYLNARAGGRVELRLVDGALDAADGALTLTDLRVGELRLGRLDLRAASQADGIRLTASLPLLAARLETTLVPSADSFTAALQLDDTDLATLATMLPAISDLPLSGRLAARADVRGTLTDPQSWSTVLLLQRLEGAAGNTTLRLRDSGRIELAPTRARADVVLEIGAASLALAGELADGSGEVTGLLSGDLADIDDLFELARTVSGALRGEASAMAGLPADLRARGPFRLLAVLRGDLADPQLQAELTVDDGELAPADLPALEAIGLRATLADGLITLERAQALWLDATLRASGRVPVELLGAGADATGRAAELEVGIEGLTLAGVAPLLDPELASRGEARLSAHATLTAAALEPAAVRGELVLDEMDLVVGAISLSQRVPTRVSIEDGAARVIDWDWTGPAGDLRVAGGATLAAAPVLDLAVEGDIDLRTLRLLLPTGVASTGRLRWTAGIAGPADAPDLRGRIELQDAELRVGYPRLTLGELNGSVDLEPGRARIEGIGGTANGGDIALSGELEYGPEGLTGGELRLVGADVAVEVPAGLRTLVDLDLRLQPALDPMVLAGDVTVLRGAYRRPLSLTSGVLEALARGTLAGRAGDGALDDVRLDVRIVTEQDVQVDNNLARLSLSADLRLGGTVAAPALTGRAELGEGGQVFLGANTYRIEAGTIDFLDPTGIEPDLTLSAVTSVSGYEITLNATGPPDTLELDLSSDPPLDRSDLVSVLVTGRTLDQAGSMQSQVAQEQVAGLLTGELSTRVGRSIGLDSVRIERNAGSESAIVNPALVAPETDPSMRLTLSKRVTDDVEVTFSQNLRDSGGFTWIFSYRVLPDVELRAVSFDNNDRSYDFSHDLRFGGGSTPAVAAAEAPRIAGVSFTGEPGFQTAQLRAELSQSPGRPFDIFRWQDDRERLERFYHERDYLEARVRARRLPHPDGGIDLVYEIERGPLAHLELTGDPLPESALQSMRSAWQDSVADEFLADELARIARAALVAQGYLQPSVDVVFEADNGAKVARVDVGSGTRTARRRIEARGLADAEARLVNEALRGRDAERNGWLDPQSLESTATEVLRPLGYLDARARAAPVERSGDTVVLPVVVDTGPLYRVTARRFEGVAARPLADVIADSGLAPGTPFTPERLRRARRAVESGYRALGFAGVEVAADAVPGDDGAVAVVLRVVEGPRQIIERIEVTGYTRTRESLVRSRLNIAPGTPVDQRALYEARRRLYDTGVFRRVDVNVEPLDEPAGQPDGPTGVEQDVAFTPVLLRVVLAERPRFRFRYGLGVSDARVTTIDSVTRDLDLGVSTDFVDRNLLGRAMTGGVSLRYESDYRAASTYLSSPTFFSLPLTSTAYVTRSREVLGADFFIPFIVDRTSLTLEQRFRIRDTVGIAYSYAYERNHTYEQDLDPDNPFAFDITVDIARLTLGALIDRRDDMFDATRGWSHSSSLEHSLRALGSDLRFVKYLGQQTFFYPVGGGVVLASAARLGLATAFDEELIPSERFFAGGGNSVRGYPEDSLGPADFLGTPTGGNALIVLKQEVRVPLAWWFRGVAFVDAGNVFERVGDLALGDLRTSWGLGLRVDTPIVLLRFDYGFRIGREPGEPRGRFFFSIGQSF